MGGGEGFLDTRGGEGLLDTRGGEGLLDTRGGEGLFRGLCEGAISDLKLEERLS